MISAPDMSPSLVDLTFMRWGNYAPCLHGFWSLTLKKGPTTIRKSQYHARDVEQCHRFLSQLNARILSLEAISGSG